MSLLIQTNPATADASTGLLPIYQDTLLNVPGSNAVAPAASTHATFGYANECKEPICGIAYNTVKIKSDRLKSQVIGSSPPDSGAIVFIVPISPGIKPYRYIVVYDSSNNPAGAFNYITTVLNLPNYLTQFIRLFNNAIVQFQIPGECNATDKCCIVVNERQPAGTIGNFVNIPVAVPIDFFRHQEIACTVATAYGAAPFVGH